MSTSDTVAQDHDAPFTTDTLRAEFTRLVNDASYFRLNGVASTTVATTPLCARGTTASKVKTTNATVLRNAGALNALAATDDFWTLTGGNLAAGSVRRYLLCADASDTASVVASDDKVIASYASAAVALAACRWAALPAAGVAIVGVLSITNVTNAFIPATTLLSAAGVTDAYIDGIDISVPLARPVSP